MTRLQARMLPDGRRLHLSDGPIDLIIGADGEAESVGLAYAAAHARFATVLDELCAELPLLRQPAGPEPSGPVARRMWRATLALAPHAFITPMAAVAGSVAEEVLSGWRGRSFSLGIADAVTVLAGQSSTADAAATLIANAVDLPGHAAVTRVPAASLQPDSDLGARPVTRAVGPLAPKEIAAALAAGVAFAETLVAERRIIAVALHLAGETRMLGRIDAGSEGQEVPRFGRGDIP